MEQCFSVISMLLFLCIFKLLIISCIGLHFIISWEQENKNIFQYKSSAIFQPAYHRAFSKSPPVTLTSVFIFSIQFSINFLRCWQREFVEHSRAFLVGDYFLYSSWPKCVIQGWYCKNKLDSSHSLERVNCHLH